MQAEPVGEPAVGPGSRLTIKAALILGFGLTLGLWLWAGYDFIQQMARVQREAAAINLRYMHAQELLAAVRPQVLILSVNARTALLDPETDHRAMYRERVTTALDSARDLLRRYVPVLNSAAERERVARLRTEIESFGQAVLEVLADDHPATPSRARELLNRIVPRRELVIGVTDEVQALNRAAFVQEQTTIAAAHRDVQTRVWVRVGLSLVASLAIAVWASVYAGWLEARLRRQREQEAQNARHLQQLSARLVKAQEQERRVIARELHDELGQVLESIKVELTLVQRQLRDVGREHLLADAQTIAQSALHTVRDLSHLLHPAVLDDLGLVAAVDVYLQSIGKRHGVHTRLEQEGLASRVSPETELAAYRIVQEALTNSVKHGSPTACTVSLQYLPSTLVITVEDDGCGFDVRTVDVAGAAAGLGLIGIRERVSQLGGVVQVNSAPGRGTTVRIELPIPPRQAAAAPAAPATPLVSTPLGTGTVGG